MNNQGFQNRFVFILAIMLSTLLISNPLELIAEDSFQYLFEQALDESHQGNFANALEHWNQFIERMPNDPAAFSNRGNVRLSLGDVQGAIADQTQAIALAPEDLDPHLNRGVAEEALGFWEEAIEDYNWILKRDPDEISALYNLGNVMGSKGEWDEAEVLFSKAAASKVGFAMARSSSALAKYQLGDINTAEFELRKLIRKYPMFADARAALSALLWRNGFFGEAESNWVAVAGLDMRYRDKDWLLNVRRWPPKAINDLMAFLALEER